MSRAGIPTTTLPAGASLRALTLHSDRRGGQAEVFRAVWAPGLEMVQWNAVISAANVLRGVHVHPRHADYLVVVQGHATIGLRDLRPGSPSEGLVAVLDMDGRSPSALVIPPGVAHGFYFHEQSIHVYAVTHYWDPGDELVCRWDDPDLAIPWPTVAPILSERDATAPPAAALRGRVAAYHPGGEPAAPI